MPPSALLSCLLCLLLQRAVGQAPDTYVVVVPAVLIFPSSENICVHLSESSGCKLEVNLKRHLQNDMLLMKRTHDQGSFECTSFLVPSPSDGLEEIASIEIALTDGKNKQIVESKDVVLQASRKLTFVQTDKPIYKAGDTVNMRIVSFDKSFLASNEKYTRVEIHDPRGNRIVQWLDAAPQQGILDLSHPVCSAPLFGNYTIKVNGSQAEQTFEIQEYAPPKYEVEAKLPLAVTSQDETISFKVCASYTYGKPVKGNVQAKLCRNAVDMNLEDICMTYNNEMGSDGCFSALADTYHFKMSSNKYSPNLKLEAHLIEEGTGVAIGSTSSSFISSFLGKVTFENVEYHYQSGMLYRGMMKLAGPDGTPLPKKTLVISINGRQTGETYTTDQNGMASFALNTASWKGSTVTLKAEYSQGQKGSYEHAQLSVKRFWADGKSYITIRHLGGLLKCGRDSTITVDFHLDPNDIDEKTRNLQFNYLVISKGGIVQHGMVKEKVSRTAATGSFTFLLQINPAVAPSATVLVYAPLLHQRIAVDSAQFHIETCFNNKVSLGFSESEVLPGSDVKLLLQAAPGSLCSIRSVDKSVLLQKPEDEITSSTDAGLKIWTNLNVKQPRDCSENEIAVGKVLMDDAGASFWPGAGILPRGLMIKSPMSMKFGLEPEPEPEERTRRWFPETWLWDLQSVGASGKKDISVPAPDTITEWKANSFCMADIGLGISPVVTLKTFKPFFADLTMPFCVVRGEGFPLKATVFNYMKECIAVQVKLVESPDFSVEPCKKCSYTSCLCENDVKTFTWHITPSSLGEVNITVIAEAIDSTKICGSLRPSAIKTIGSKDTLRKVLLVRAEGVLVEKAHSSLMCNVASEKFSLEVPTDILKGSVMADVSVTGYQHQLNFKHSDGSYSSFGNQDPTGSPWLTALVAQFFYQGKEYTYIDEKDIQDAVNWLKKSQMPNGSFRNEGKLINNALKAGEDNDVCLTAYVTMTLLELQTPRNDSVLDKAFQFLDSINIANCSLYKKALMTIVYTKDGNKEKRKQLLQDLDKNAIKSGGEMYWTETPQANRKETFWPTPNPADVKLTSIVLTAIASDKTMSRSDWKTALCIEKWLIKQQNTYGGFSTTQDTMVALQAIAKHAERTYSPGGKVNVLVSSSGGFQHKFAVQGNTRLLLQKTALPEIPGQYTIGLSGRGCVVVMTTLRYNLPLTKNTAAFNIEAWTSPEECTEASRKRFTVNLQVSYTGNRTSTNMVVLEVKMVSGFAADSKSIKALQQVSVVKKIEISDFGYVNVYLDEVTREAQDFSFVVEQYLPITNPKSALVRVYDYYQSVEEAVGEYSGPCH